MQLQLECGFVCIHSRMLTVYYLSNKGMRTKTSCHIYLQDNQWVLALRELNSEINWKGSGQIMNKSPHNLVKCLLCIPLKESAIVFSESVLSGQPFDGISPVADCWKSQTLCMNEKLLRTKHSFVDVSRSVPISSGLWNINGCFFFKSRLK